MGIFSRGHPEDYPEGSFPPVVVPDFLSDLPPGHMPVVKLEIKRMGGKIKHRIGKGLERQILHEAVARMVEILPQAIAELYVMLGVLAVQAVLRA